MLSSNTAGQKAERPAARPSGRSGPTAGRRARSGRRQQLGSGGQTSDRNRPGLVGLVTSLSHPNLVGRSSRVGARCILM
jgi:hypothetical protein